MQGLRFTFTGTLGLNPMESARPWYRDGGSKGWKAISASVIKDGNNRGFVEMFGAKPKDGKIITRSVENKELTIPWDSRDMVSGVANYRKNIIDLGDGNVSEFITPYDAVEFIVNHCDDLKDHKVTVTGDVRKDFYNGNIRNVYSIKNIYRSRDEVKNKLQLTGEIYWTHEDFDTSDWKDSKKIYLNAYTREYVSSASGEKFVRQTFVIDASNMDLSDEAVLKKFKFAIKGVGLAYEDGVIKNTLKKDKVYRTGAVFSLVNGNEVRNITEDELTPYQKEAYEAGLGTLEEILGTNKVMGNRVSEIKLINYNLALYPDGYVEDDLSVREFEDMIYVAPEANTVEAVYSGAAEEPDTDDLFD